MRFNELALLTACPSCPAGVGQWCITKSGKRATHIHAARWEGPRVAWYEGYIEGRGDMAQHYIEINDPNHPYSTQASFDRQVQIALEDARAVRG